MIDLQETVIFIFKLTFSIGFGVFLTVCLRWFVFDYLDLSSSNKN
jgi:hypothetical protein